MADGFSRTVLEIRFLPHRVRIRKTECAYCEREFQHETHHGGQIRYCSPECRKASVTEYNKFYWRMRNES